MTNPVYPYPYSQAAKLDKRITVPRPVIDPILAPLLDSCPLPENFNVQFMRGVAEGTTAAEGSDESQSFVYNADTVLAAAPHLQHTEYAIPGPDGNTVVLSVFSPKQPSSKGPLPCLYHMHGGGMVAGDRFTAVPELMGVLGDKIECVVVSVEYRLAPETKAPGAAKDCYAGLVWIAQKDNATRLGIDPARIVVWGVSGGAATAAAACLMVRDNKALKVPVKGLMLLSPMIDDRADTNADQQFAYGSPWTSIGNAQAWDAILDNNKKHGDPSVTPYEAPGRAEDLANMPPTYVDVGECDVFRDDAVQFASKMWRCGSTCELHVWPGAFHLFDGMDNPAVPLVRSAIEAKRNWLQRMML